MKSYVLHGKENMNIEISNPQISLSEIARMPEHTVEIESKMRVGSFGQELFIRTHQTDQGIVRKIAGISLPYPVGVKREDVIDIMMLATSAQDSEVKGWDGLKKGRIETFAVDRPNSLDPAFEIKRFIWASKTILEKRYGNTDAERTDDMNKYFDLLDVAWSFADEAARDVENILNNPSNTGWKAFNERYFGKGLILVECIQVDGEVYGNPPFGGDPVLLKNIAIDEPHQLWLEDGYIAEVNSANGDKIIADCEDTETVGGPDGGCAGTPTCSVFFSLMEKGLETAKLATNQTKSAFIKVIDTWSGIYYICSSCHNKKEDCSCGKI
ncbi:MAG: hypothetical protein AAB414_03065 [Patescibacteria group bacterium]